MTLRTAIFSLFLALLPASALAQDPSGPVARMTGQTPAESKPWVSSGDVPILLALGGNALFTHSAFRNNPRVALGGSMFFPPLFGFSLGYTDEHTPVGLGATFGTQALVSLQSYQFAEATFGARASAVTAGRCCTLHVRRGPGRAGTIAVAASWALFGLGYLAGVEAREVQNAPLEVLQAHPPAPAQQADAFNHQLAQINGRVGDCGWLPHSH